MYLVFTDSDEKKQQIDDVADFHYEPVGGKLDVRLVDGRNENYTGVGNVSSHNQ